VWVAGGAEYGSGLPFEFDGIQEDATAQLVQAITDSEFRPGPRQTQSVDRCLSRRGFCGSRTDSLSRQADAANIKNRFNLLDFAGLFAGTAIEPPRNYALRLTNTF
jgi:hypothetical protein